MNPRLITLALLFAGMPVLASDPAPKPDTSEGFERYRIIIKRNIFLRDKSKASESAFNRRTEEKKTEEKTPAVAKEGPLPLRAESQMVLNGIVCKDGNVTAFFENRKDGTTVAVHAGDKLIDGTVSAITLDSVDYSNNGTRTIITIGKALDGTIADPKTADSFKASVPGGAATADPAAASENALLEKMRKRRQEEMRK